MTGIGGALGRRPRVRGALLLSALASCAVAVSACGAQTALTAAVLDVPVASHPATLATGTYDTSPDGGIYINPDPIRVTLRGRIPMQPLAAELRAGRQWAALRGLGDLTVVGFRLTNSGLAGSNPQLNNLQIATSSWSTCAAGGAGAVCPQGVSRATFSRFYYPAYPLAGLSTVSIDGQCSLNVDPGQTVTVLLVYPPIRPTSYLTWGEYGSFEAQLPTGGGIPRVGALRATLCTPPDTQAP